MKIAEPAWSEAMGHGEDQSGSRQDRTRGHAGESRGGPREQAAAAATVHECTPDGARGAGQGSSQWSSLKQFQQFQSQPASDERVGKGSTSVF